MRSEHTISQGFEPVEVDVAKYSNGSDVIDAFRFGRDQAPGWFAKAVFNGQIAVEHGQAEMPGAEPRVIATTGDYIGQRANGELFIADAAAFEADWESAE